MEKIQIIRVKGVSYEVQDVEAQTKTDNNLSTESKEVVGAINELQSKILLIDNYKPKTQSPVVKSSGGGAISITLEPDKFYIISNPMANQRIQLNYNSDLNNVVTEYKLLIEVGTEGGPVLESNKVINWSKGEELVMIANKTFEISLLSVNGVIYGSFNVYNN